MNSPPLVPAEPAAAGDGTPYSTIYGDVYHATHGALAQARHVFLDGNDLPTRWQDTDQFVILETGFGLGLNFLTTWQAWRESQARGRLHFVSIEKHPFRRVDLATLLARHAELAPLAAELLRQWPPLTPGFHRLHFGDRLTLTLIFGEATHLLPQLDAKLDALYLDGFAPSKNPELWSAALIAALTRHCRAGATLATWSVAGELRRALEYAGWQVARRPGFAPKREMLAGQLGNAVLPAPTVERRAIVIGAGLAGCAICERLTARGWHVDLFERHAAPAQEASGNPSGILLPHMAKDDALAARLSRACYLYVLRRLGELEAVRWAPCGVLQIARDAAHETLQRATVEYLELPPEFVAFLEQAQATALVGRRVAHGGWWFPGGGWVSPQSVCRALLAERAELVSAHFGAEVAALRRTDAGWQALDEDGGLLASAPHVILANALAANRLLPAALPLAPIRGQISYLPEAVLNQPGAALRHALCRSGYITPPQDGFACIGASFDNDDSDLSLRAADHQGNLQRLEELLPGATNGVDAARLDGRVALRTATPDRLPIVGTLPDTTGSVLGTPELAALPRLTGLHALLGLSARGMVWAPLAAEFLASQLEGEPLPLERDLVAAVDPARFHLRALRRGKPSL